MAPASVISVLTIKCFSRHRYTEIRVSNKSDRWANFRYTKKRIFQYMRSELNKIRIMKWEFLDFSFVPNKFRY